MRANGHTGLVIQSNPPQQHSNEPDSFLADESEEEEDDNEEEEAFTDDEQPKKKCRQDPQPYPELPPILAPFFTKMWVQSELHLVFSLPLHSFSRYSFFPYPDGCEITDRLRVVIRSDPPPAFLLTTPDSQNIVPLFGYQFVEPPTYIESSYLLPLPVKIDITRAERKKFMITERKERLAEHGIHPNEFEAAIIEKLQGFEIIVFPVPSAPKILEKKIIEL